MKKIEFQRAKAAAKRTIKENKKQTWIELYNL